MSELGDLLRALGNATPVQQTQYFSNQSPVANSAELERILALPRRTANALDHVDIQVVSNKYRRPNGTMLLRPIQAWALEEARTQRGLIAPIGVGQGKCVTGDTEFFDGEKRRSVKEAGSALVYTIDDSQKIKQGTATVFPSGRKECLRIEVENGMGVGLSLDHPVFTPDGWKQSQFLKVGDFIGVPARLPQPSKPLSISDEEVELLGFLLADGSYSHTQLAFYDASSEVLERVQKLVMELGGVATARDTSSKATRLNLSRLQKLKDKYNLRFTKSVNKRIPDSFYALSDYHIQLFLRAFIACDGHIGTTHIEITLSSKEFIKDLQYLFLRLGMRAAFAYKKASIGKQKFAAWRLSVFGKQLIPFLKSGTFYGIENRKNNLLNYLETTETNPNKDVIPLTYGHHRILAEELNKPKTEIKKRLAFTQGQFISRHNFKNFADEYKYTGKYAWLAKSDIRWEKVKSISNIGEQEVFDLNVPKTESWIGNGIILHNTLLSLLLPRAMDVATSVLFVPAALKRQLQNNYDEYLQHWVLPNLYDYKFDTTVKNMLYVFSYDELSSPKKFDLLSRINPDLLICDEAHNLKALSAARTKRLLRYFKARPTTLFCAMSGTLISRSIMDFGHLAPLALRERTPTPMTYPVRVEWAAALDPGLERAPPGELMRFCRPGEDVRVGFRRRLTETHGVVASPPEIFPVSLNIFKRKPSLDDETQGVMLGVRKTWSLPTGENFDSALSYWRAMTQLACGFYYRWIWPNGEPEDVRREWMDARREWNAEVRDYLQKRASAGMDSPGLLAEAAASGKWASAAWARWAAVKDSAEPATEPVWISDCIVQEAVQWGRNNVGIIWYAHDAFGQAVAKAGGFPLCGGGPDTGIEKEDGSRTIVASIDAHGTGKQLHMFSRALVTTPPGSNEGWEQLLGRLHRPGQTADEVNFDVYQHTIELQEAFTRARDEAPFVAGVLDVRPRLTYATII